MSYKTHSQGVDLSVLNAIMDRDPDGGEVEPTEAAHAAHKAWAIAAYGQKAWDVYAPGGWGPEPEV